MFRHARVCVCVCERERERERERLPTSKLPPKLEVKASTTFVVEDAFFMEDEDPRDVLLAPSGPGLF